MTEMAGTNHKRIYDAWSCTHNIKSMRICHVVNRLSDTTMARDLATGQANIGDISQVTIVSLETPSSRVIGEKLEMVTLDHPSDSHLLDASGLADLRATFEEHDLVHTHHHLSGAYAKILGRLHRKPVVVTEHNNHGGYRRTGRIVNGLTNVLADSIVCVSETVRDSFRRWEGALLSQEDVKVIHNGVDIGRIARAKELDWSIYQQCDISEDAFVVSTAGMLIEQKAHETLIDAVDLLNAEGAINRPIELVISGEGDRREQLEQQIESSRYENRFHLLGFLDERNQVFRMMHESDVYAMPSRWEGFCVAALEALATGTPCVFSDIPAFENYFSDVSLLHEAGDSEDLAEKLEMMLSNERMRSGYAKAGRDLVLDEYSLERTTERYYEIYADLI